MQHSWKRSFNAIWFAEFIAIAGFATTTPLIPLYFRELGVVDSGALNVWNGVTQSLSSLALMIFAPIWGSLADSYGRKPMVLRAMIGGSLMVGLMAATNAPWQVLLLRTLQGCVTGTVGAATVLVASLVPEKETGYRLGLLQMAIYLGSSVGPLLGGIVSDNAGIRVNFIITGILLGVAAMVVLHFVEERFVPKKREGSLLSRAMPDFKSIFRRPDLLSILAVGFSIQFASAVVMPILPLHILAMTGSGEKAASISGAIIGSGAFAGAVAAVLVGRISGSFGYGRTLLVCLLGAFAFYLPQGMIVDPFILLAFRVGSGMFLGGMMPSINALLARLSDPENQGSLYGLSSSVSSAGMAVGPLVGALVATGFGYPAVFYVTSAILLLTALGSRLGLRRIS